MRGDHKLYLQFGYDTHFIVSVVVDVVKLQEAPMLEAFHYIHLALYILSFLLVSRADKLCSQLETSLLLGALQHCSESASAQLIREQVVGPRTLALLDHNLARHKGRLVANIQI